MDQKRNPDGARKKQEAKHGNEGKREYAVRNEDGVMLVERRSKP
jgi:hypothetical protein